ncbi:5-formyltetrahydrofolate cyclo-ligase [Rhodopseudomonas rhenobacensis]|uniref:5-formyltetrahydrofolate cyclo-ligase n=1 Tax=Rhodopseudomonas rhenobacensis TaxID=87461 RepID=A0A7W8E0S2_9BRAD|nr:5-formyltetrahydrofolate cyclo-ligase [Rhodopseudomonas rhenobacensis]MBB5049217.1 5-formyltetrahydrofolate cyclo-ligase [Rhodopseudomonas rhenobacensis]
MPLISLDRSKTSLRAAALARRAALSETARAAAAQALLGRPFPLAITAGDVVAGYFPLRGEFDPRPLLQALAEQGARLALPAIVGPDRPLAFRAWHPGEPLVKGQLGIPEPAAAAPALTPRTLLVPLAAFDRAGHRIGYGGGYYDRSLEALRRDGVVTAIGLGFAVQEIPLVPALAHDARLDLVLTEAETIDFRS